MPVEIRLSRPDDLVRMSVGAYAPVPGAKFVGWTALSGRRVVAMGGVTRRDNQVWGYFMIADDYRGSFPLRQHRLAKRLLHRLARAGVVVRAECEADRPRALEWLQRLGFVPNAEEPGIFVFGGPA